MQDDFSKITLLRFYLKHWRKMLPTVVAGFICGLYISFMGMAAPYLLKLITDTAAAYTDNRAVGIDKILPYVYILLGLSFLNSASYRTLFCMFGIFIPRRMAAIRTQILDYTLNHAQKYFSDNFAGSLAHKVHDLANTFHYFTRIVLWVIIPGAATFVIAFVMFWKTEPVLGCLIAGWMICIAAIQIFLSRKYYHIAADYAESRSRLTGALVDIMTNQSSVRLFAGHRQTVDTVFTEYQETERKKNTRMKLFGELINALINLSAFLLCIVGVVSYSVYCWKQGLISAGDIVMIVTATWKVIDKLWELAWEIPNLVAEWGTAKQAWNVLTKPHEITDKPDGSALEITNGAIDFDNIEFNYSVDNPLFDKLSLSVYQGQKIGLVGESGAGKTTLMNLLLRLYDVHGGAIRIDGQNIAEVTQESLHRHISVIPQDPSLFHRSLMENIRFARPEASDDEVYLAAQSAQIHDFIMTLPHGYETLVGERGIKLSGGQRQRVAIARAFLKNAPILVIDEGTSSLDSITENEIQESLYGLMEGRTTIVVAHRLSTLRRMDRIIVLDNGKIIEDGTHEELINNPDGLFTKLWSMQAGGFLPEKL